MIKHVNGVEVKMTEEEVAEFNANLAAWEASADERLSEHVRKQRDEMLSSEVDPIVSNPLRWAALTAEQQQAWADYRQALLDITTQTGFPQNVVWPSKPEV